MKILKGQSHRGAMAAETLDTASFNINDSKAKHTPARGASG
jgi:hypothetical protein